MKKNNSETFFKKNYKELKIKLRKLDWIKISYRTPILFSIFSGIIFGAIIVTVDLRYSMSLLNQYRPSTPTRLFDRDGNVFSELYMHRQELVSISEIPPSVIHAFLAVEDTEFYTHIGINFVGIVRAAFVNLLARDIVQGGSTLTQQLAKQIYLNSEGKRERSIIQKIRETILTFQIEEELSKEEILEIFFNVIYLGHGCKGIACASRLYFEKKVSELTLAEGALLARLLKAPVSYSPYKNPTLARKAHLLVLRKMARLGYLNINEVDELHKNFWLEYWPKIILKSPNQSAWGERLDKAPYFTDYVRQILETVPEIGADKLYNNSLNIYTTLDITHQRIATEEMEKTRASVNKSARNFAVSRGVGGVDFRLFELLNVLKLLFPTPNPAIQDLPPQFRIREQIEEELLDGLQLLTNLNPGENESALMDNFREESSTNFNQLQIQQAFVSIQPQTGYITSMIGGNTFSPRNQYNRVLQARRQPGSAFKILVYGAALEQRKISSMSPINDAPILQTASDGSSWTPENYEPGFRGLVPARRALAYSLNTCAAEVYFMVGPDAIINLAGRLMKIADPTTRFNPEPSLALGAGEVTPMELTTAVSIIANGGRDVIPFAIRYVTDGSGDIIYNQEDEVRNTLSIKAKENKLQIIEPGLAYILRDMLQHVGEAGTASSGLKTIADYKGQLACKTGTTSNYTDAWITGFNPEFAATVWFGFDKSSLTMGPGQSGGGTATPVIGRFFRNIYKEKNLPYPKFEDQNDWATAPKGVYLSECKGLALVPKQIDGELKKLKEPGPCGGARVYDERALLMQELGITPEELGGNKKDKVLFR